MGRKSIISRDLSECETLIMKVIWDAREDIAVQDLIVQLKQQYGKDYARTTVVTFLHKMMEKGFVRTYRVGKAAYVQALKKEDDYKRQLMKIETDFWFGGKPSKLMASLCEAKSVTKEEANKIMELLNVLDD